AFLAVWRAPVPARRGLRRLERRAPRQEPDGIGAAHPPRGGGVPVRPPLGAERRRAGAEVARLRRLRAALLPVLLFLLPVIAYAPAWWEGRLLGPGDGAALHFPLRAAAWESWRGGDLPAWNPAIFLGTPLLA